MLELLELFHSVCRAQYRLWAPRPVHGAVEKHTTSCLLFFPKPLCAAELSAVPVLQPTASDATPWPYCLCWTDGWILRWVSFSTCSGLHLTQGVGGGRLLFWICCDLLYEKLQQPHLPLSFVCGGMSWRPLGPPSHVSRPFWEKDTDRVSDMWTVFAWWQGTTGWGIASYLSSRIVTGNYLVIETTVQWRAVLEGLQEIGCLLAFSCGQSLHVKALGQLDWTIDDSPAIESFCFKSGSLFDTRECVGRHLGSPRW